MLTALVVAEDGRPNGSWQWQLGELFRALGNALSGQTHAIRAPRHAVEKQFTSATLASSVFMTIRQGRNNRNQCCSAL